MHDLYRWSDARRRTPRVGVDAVCWDEHGREALVVDLSAEGFRLERPWTRPWMQERIQLEVELPDVDEVVWLAGEVCFDRRRHRLQSTGVRVVAATARDLGRLRDVVVARARALAELCRWDLADAGCYARG